MLERKEKRREGGISGQDVRIDQKIDQNDDRSEDERTDQWTKGLIRGQIRGSVPIRTHGDDGFSHAASRSDQSFGHFSLRDDLNTTRAQHEVQRQHFEHR